jgi:outer membrane protein insertion porin family
MHQCYYLIFSILLYSAPLLSQSTVQRYEVGELQFEGNTSLNNDQLLNVIQTRETPKAIWKSIYHFFNKEILGGQKPEYYDPITFASDYIQLKRFYTDNGFIHSNIDTAILADDVVGKVYLKFTITENRRSTIDTILYNGFEMLPPDVVEEISANKVIAVGEPYIYNKIETELRRIVGILANNGYVNVKVISLDARHYTSTDNFSVIFSFNPGKRYTFGNIGVEEDTSSTQKVDTSIVLQHLDFKEDEYYGEQKKIESEKNLNRLGIFEAAKIENAIPNDSTFVSQIPVRILVRARSFQELTPEIGMNDENDAFNVLFGIGYNHRNFFGGARNYSTRLRFNLQTLNYHSIFEGNILQNSSLVSKAELTMQLIQPYFFNNKTSISFALSAMLDKQATYYIPSLSSRIGIQSQTATYTRLFIDWNLQLSDPKTVATRQDTAIGTEWTKQFNSFITLTLQRDKRNDLFYPSDGFFHSIAIEEGGLFPKILGSPLGIDLPYSQYVKMTLVGQWYFDPGKKRDFIWATRWRTGAALNYGNSVIDLPISQRFFSGGSGSIRGWRARELGALPIGVPNLREQGGNAFFEGNLEARWNFLSGWGTFWFLDLEKFSLVFFYDCGNMWPTPQKMRITEIAMAFGFGIRYNTIAGPIRIDFGMKAYDPDGEIWVTQKRFFPETFTQGVIHLGVGHTF